MHHGTLECMAGEIAHIVYAARLLTTLKSEVSHHSYWVGTVFPDIYRLRAPNRYPTHLRPVILSRIVGHNDFTTGMRVHTWIDETSEHYMREHRVYERLPWHPLLPFALELFEDEMLYGAYEDWGIVRRALATIYPDEVAIVHEQSTLHTWHTILENYFRAVPSNTSRSALCDAIGISKEIAADANRIVHALKNGQAAKEIIYGYIGELEHMLV